MRALSDNPKQGIAKTYDNSGELFSRFFFFSLSNPLDGFQLVSCHTRSFEIFRLLRPNNNIRMNFGEESQRLMLGSAALVRCFVSVLIQCLINKLAEMSGKKHWSGTLK
jgi:hypothetical protein